MSEKASAATERYSKRRGEIVSAAMKVLNEEGVKGMTLSEVATLVGLNTTSLTYYFRKKEDLAAACHMSAIDLINSAVLAASIEATPAARITAFIKLMFKLNADYRRKNGPQLGMLGDLRALDEPQRSVVVQHFSGMVLNLRALFQSFEHSFSHSELRARAYLLLDQLHWATLWVMQCELEEYPRLCARFTDILLNGFAKNDASWPPSIIDPEEIFPVQPDNGREIFLRASTRVFTRLGYSSASVDKISAELHVTKGSFYHHNETKEELALACYERTRQVGSSAYAVALRTNDLMFDRLSSGIASTLAFQTSQYGPLLRPLSLRGLPRPLRDEVWSRTRRQVNSLAGYVSDGIADGSIRAIDPIIGANVLFSTSHTASSAINWTTDGVGHDLVNLLAKPTLHGLLTT
ncbi:MAG: TetR family transcriptional regulator [Caulobacterales bacterium]